MKQASGHGWTFWPRPEPGFGMQNYSVGLIVGLEGPIATALAAFFFIPSVRAWTGCDPWIIAAAFSIHFFFHVFAIAGGLHRHRPRVMEFLTNAMDLLATLAIPLSSREHGMALWVLYLFVTLIAAYSNPGVIASFLLILAGPWIDVLLHVGEADIARGKIETAAILTAVLGTVYPVTSHFSSMVRRSHREGIEKNKALAALSERARLGESLHGTLGAALSEIALWQDMALSETGRTSGSLAKAQVRARSALAELRAVVADLDGRPLALESLADGVRGQAQGLCEAAGATLRVDVEGAGTLDQASAYHLAKIALEAITNAARHARPKNVTVRISGNPVSLEVEDDGEGFAPARATRGRGMRALEEHAEALRAGLRVDSAPGAGTRVVVTASGGGAA